MKRKIKSILRLVFSMTLILVTVLPCSQVCARDVENCATTLYDLGLVAGIGTNQDGTPEFALDHPMTRNEAIVMLARFVGAEKLPTFDTYTSPFTDVPSWALHHVGYAYSTGMTKGISETTFGGDLNIDKAQFCALILRALGYSGDFTWSEAAAFAQTLGLVPVGEADAFSRGDAFQICYNALSTKVKNGQLTLLQILTNRKMIDADKIAKNKLTQYLCDVVSFPSYPGIPSVLNVCPYLTVSSTLGGIYTDNIPRKHTEHFYSISSIDDVPAICAAYSTYLQDNGFDFLLSATDSSPIGAEIEYAFLSPDNKLLVTAGGKYNDFCVTISELPAESEVTTYPAFPSVVDYGAVNSRPVFTKDINCYTYADNAVDVPLYAALLSRAGFTNSNRAQDHVASTTHTFLRAGTAVRFDSKTVRITSFTSAPKEIPVYAETPDVPDLGGMLGATPHTENRCESGAKLYAYKNIPSEHTLYSYFTLLVEAGFSFDGYDFSENLFSYHNSVRKISINWHPVGNDLMDITKLDLYVYSSPSDVIQTPTIPEINVDNVPDSSEDDSKNIPTIQSADDLENYLRAAIGTIDTPFGAYRPIFEVSYNYSNSMAGYDYEIKVDYPPSSSGDFRDDAKVNKEEAVRIYRDLQRTICEVASEAVPDAKLVGYYFMSGYEYKYIKVGYWSYHDCCWRNFSGGDSIMQWGGPYNETYITGFHWTPEHDDHHFVFGD